jgi:hypothetical protein
MIQRFWRAKTHSCRFVPFEESKFDKLQFSDKKRSSLRNIKLCFPLDFNRQDFTLDFSSVMSDRSTTDCILSDEDPNGTKRQARQIPLKQVELE